LFQSLISGSAAGNPDLARPSFRREAEIGRGATQVCRSGEPTRQNGGGPQLQDAAPREGTHGGKII